MGLLFPQRSLKFPRAQLHSFSQDNMPPCETGPLGMTNVHQPSHPSPAALRDPAGASTSPYENLGHDSYSRARRSLAFSSAVSAAGMGKASPITLLRDWKARELQTVGSVGCSVSQAKFKPWSFQNIVKNYSKYPFHNVWSIHILSIYNIYGGREGCCMTLI